MLNIIYCLFKDNIPLFISVLALLFSVLSFWWIHWRRGKIIVSLPIKFGLNYNKSTRKIIVQLPLTFYNNGAAALIINNLRIEIKNISKTEYLFFNKTFKDLESNEERNWGYAFPVEGRKTYSKVFVFMNVDIDFIIPSDFIEYSLEAQINNKNEWKILYRDKLITLEKYHKTMYEILRAYNNYQ